MTWHPGGMPAVSGISPFMARRRRRSEKAAFVTWPLMRLDCSRDRREPFVVFTKSNCISSDICLPALGKRDIPEGIDARTSVILSRAS